MTKEEIDALNTAYNQVALGREAPTLMYICSSREDLQTAFARLTAQGNHDAARAIKVILDAMDAQEKPV